MHWADAGADHRFIYEPDDNSSDDGDVSDDGRPRPPDVRLRTNAPLPCRVRAPKTETVCNDIQKRAENSVAFLANQSTSACGAVLYDDSENSACAKLFLDECWHQPTFAYDIAPVLPSSRQSVGVSASSNGARPGADRPLAAAGRVRMVEVEDNKKRPRAARQQQAQGSGGGAADGQRGKRGKTNQSQDSSAGVASTSDYRRRRR